MPACLLACLLACLPAFLPACLCELMVAYLLACLSLPAWLFACRCLHTSIHSCIPSFIHSSNQSMPFQSMPSCIYSNPLRAILAPSCLSCPCLARTTGVVSPGSLGCQPWITGLAILASSCSLDYKQSPTASDEGHHYCCNPR